MGLIVACEEVELFANFQKIRQKGSYALEKTVFCMLTACLLVAVSDGRLTAYILVAVSDVRLTAYLLLAVSDGRLTAYFLVAI